MYIVQYHTCIGHVIEAALTEGVRGSEGGQADPRMGTIYEWCGGM